MPAPEAELPHVWSATRVPGFNDGMLWDPPENVAEMEARLSVDRRAWESGIAFGFTIETRDSGEFLGRISIDRGSEPGEWSIGFWVHPDHQGRGYATEAAAALVEFGFGRLGARVITAAHASWNEASRKVLERIGMKVVRLNPRGFQKKGRWVEEREYELRRGTETRVTSLDDLQPSQLYIHSGKLENVIGGMRESGPESFAPVPVKRLGARLVLTDGHTRAVAAHRLGAREIATCREEDDLDWKAYRICVRWCRKEGIQTISDLAERVVDEKTWGREWLEPCRRLHGQLAAQRAAIALWPDAGAGAVTDAFAFLEREVTVVMDRPLGSRHPREGFEYPVNYGYVPGTCAADGHETDAYVVGVDRPLDTFTGTCVAVIERLDDVEDKLVVAPAGVDFDDDEIRSLTEFQEQFFELRIVRSGGAPSGHGVP